MRSLRVLAHHSPTTHRLLTDHSPSPDLSLTFLWDITRIMPFVHLPSLHPCHAVVALTLAAWFPAATAIERGTSAAGVVYASGGVIRC